MSERLQKGQPVITRSDLQVGKSYGLVFVASMESYRGKSTRVSYVYEDNYDLEIDNGRHGWTDRMLVRSYNQSKEVIDAQSAREETQSGS